MSTTIVRGTNNKPGSSEALTQCLAQHDDFSGELFIGYPIIRTAVGRHLIDALLVSIETGIVVFDLIEGPILDEDYRERQDDSANKLEAHLKSHPELVQRRDLRIPIHTLSFAPALNSSTIPPDDDYPIANSHTLIDRLRQLQWGTHSSTVYECALSVVECTSTIRKSATRREVENSQSRGAKLKSLEDSIATLDAEQNKAVIETVDGVQRIRGLAGSGKTIVLALKAAYLHAQHPDWRIAVTFNTRSLKDHFRRLIERFCLHQIGEDPDWDRLRVVNAWGAPGRPERDGIYYEFCRTHGVDYFDFRSANRAFGRGREFAEVCRHALEQARDTKPIYDVVLVDEAQDFAPDFLRLCYQLLDESKRLIYAYDELQNLSDNSLPPPEIIFGADTSGAANVHLDGPRDIILGRCYRNSRPVLVTAHALGFGAYRKPREPEGLGLVQMFDSPHLWEEIGYERKAGSLRAGSEVTLGRTERTSPRFLEDHSEIDDLIQFIHFNSSQEQTEWIAAQIRRNLEIDELRHDDIIVVNPDPLKTRKEVAPIRKRLLQEGINSHVAGVDTEADTFFRVDRESVTFTGIHRAKGNEAGMVYIINAQDCHSSALNLASIRNRLFTAVTRSKAWIRVLGIGSGMMSLIGEYEQLKSHRFELQFTYPTEDQREHLRIVHRDMTEQELLRLRDRERTVRDWVYDLESGNVSIEDFDEEVIEKLKKHIGSFG